MSACNNLRQYNIPYSLTALHTVDPGRRRFARRPRALRRRLPRRRGLRQMRVGMHRRPPGELQHGALQREAAGAAGISVETLDLSEVFGRIERLADDDPAVRPSGRRSPLYADTRGVPGGGAAQDGQARRRRRRLDGRPSARRYGHPVLDRHGGVLRRRAVHRHEHDQRQPHAQRLRDRHRRRRRHAMPWRWPRARRARCGLEQQLRRRPRQGGRLPLLATCRSTSSTTITRMDYQAIIAGTVGKENTYGTIVGRVQGRDPFTYCASPPTTWRARSRLRRRRRIHQRPARYLRRLRRGARCRDLQDLLHFICEQRLRASRRHEPARTAAAVREALKIYLGWDVYLHGG